MGGDIAIIESSSSSRSRSLCRDLRQTLDLDPSLTIIIISIYYYRNLEYILNEAYNAYCRNERSRGFLDPILNPNRNRLIGNNI